MKLLPIMRLSVLSLLLPMLSSLALVSCTVTTKLQDPPTMKAHPDKAKTEIAIKSALAERGWRVVAQRDSRVDAAFDFGSARKASVMVAFDPNTVTVSDTGSEGLNYGSTSGTAIDAIIDPRYNEAVETLAKAIQIAIAKIQ